MSLISELSGVSEPCDAFAQCENQPLVGVPIRACDQCKFAKRLGGRSNRWAPYKPGLKHPLVVQAKRAQKREADQVKQDRKRNRDRAKMRVLSLAARAEKQTDRNIIKATKNSGRTNRDGDHVMAGQITLDTKLQTTRLNPVVQVAELEKVRADARRGGNSIGALVLRNENGHGFVVLAEEDFAQLVKGLQ